MATPRSKKTASRTKVRSVTPFLWFEKDCARAAEFYLSLFAGSRMLGKSPMGCEFELAGQRIMALNGGPSHKLTPAFSLFVTVETQAQVDELWRRLTTDGGEEQPCGWLVDKFGVSWQIIPERLTDLLAAKDPRVAEAAVGAMLKMTKIEIADLDAAVAAVKPRSRPRKGAA